MSKYWEEPLFVSDGDTVWLPYNAMAFIKGEARSMMAWRCKVITACGNHATIVYIKEKGGGPIIKHLVPLKALLVPPDDYKHPNNSEKIMQEVWKAACSQS